METLYPVATVRVGCEGGEGLSKEDKRADDLRREGDDTESCQDSRSRRRVMDVSHGMGGRRTRTRKLDGLAVMGW